VGRRSGKAAIAIDPEAGLPNAGHGNWTREGVKSYLERRYSTRLHMSAILAASGLVAMLASSMLLSFGVTSMLVRYPVGIVLSYLTFLVGIFVWLRLMGLRTNSGAKTDLVDASDAADISWSSGGSSGGGGGFSLPKGGGGMFDGGGANASFAEAQARMPLIQASMQQGPAVRGSKSSSGFSLDLGGDGDAIVLLLLAALLVLVVFLTSGYLIWMGPDILAEAAFGALLAGGLTRRTKRETAAGWVAGVVKKTWWPFALVLVVAMVLTSYAQQHYPAAQTIGQAFALAFH
jgi:hypothetical protein